MTKDIQAFGIACHQQTMQILKRQKIGAAFKQGNREARYISNGYRLADSTQLDKVLALTAALATKTALEPGVFAMRRRGLVFFEFPLPPDLIRTYSLADLEPGAIGVGHGQKSVIFLPQKAFRKSPGVNPQTCVLGGSGSGKTNTIKVILLSLMRQRKPDTVRFYVTDTKSGLTEFDNSVYLAAPIARTQEAQSEMINLVRALIDQRSQQRAQGKADFSQELLILGIDESMLLTAKDKQHLAYIASQGRDLFIWLVVGAQYPNKFLKNVYPFLENRLTGKVAAGESYQATKVARMNIDTLLGEGDFVRVDKFDSTRFQVPLVTAADMLKLERGQVPPPTKAEVQPVVELLKKPGRPVKIPIQPDILSLYVLYAEHNNKVPIALAERFFKFSVSGDKFYINRLYKDAARMFLNTRRALKRGKYPR